MNEDFVLRGDGCVDGLSMILIIVRGRTLVGRDWELTLHRCWTALHSEQNSQHGICNAIIERVSFPFHYDMTVALVSNDDAAHNKIGRLVWGTLNFFVCHVLVVADSVAIELCSSI